MPGWLHCVYPVFLPSPKHSRSWQRVAAINGRLDRWESWSVRPRMPLFCCQSKSGRKKSVAVLYQTAEWERSLQVSLHSMLNWTNPLSVLSRSHPIVPITMTACLELNMWVLPEWRWISNLSSLSSLSAPAGLFASSKQDCRDFSPGLRRCVPMCLGRAHSNYSSEWKCVDLSVTLFWVGQVTNGLRKAAEGCDSVRKTIGGRWTAMLWPHCFSVIQLCALEWRRCFVHFTLNVSGFTLSSPLWQLEEAPPLKIDGWM